MQKKDKASHPSQISFTTLSSHSAHLLCDTQNRILFFFFSHLPVYPKYSPFSHLLSKASWIEVLLSIRSQVCPRPILATTATTILKARPQIPRLLRIILSKQKSIILLQRLPPPSTACILHPREQELSRGISSAHTTLHPATAVEAWRNSRIVRPLFRRMGETIKIKR